MLKEIDLLGKKLLLITAHPDDESFAMAGTLYKNLQAGGKTVLVCATLGERGDSHLKRPMTKTQLMKMRKEELQRVTAFLNFHKVYLVGIPDSAVAQNKLQLSEKVEKALLNFPPDFIIGFDHNGVSGHNDHIAAGQVAKQLAKKHAIQYLTFSLPPKLLKYQNQLRKRRKKGSYVLKELVHDKPTLKIAVNKKIKERVLKFHASQMETPFLKDFPRDCIELLLTTEYFIER